jgi:mxaJ protein
MILLLLATLTLPRELRVCSDPDNLPFSNRRGEGFENKIAELLARSLNARLQYTWWAQGSLQSTLEGRSCDVVMGVPARADSVLPTQPYYRSSYVFVWRKGARAVRSLDDPALRGLRIGVPVVGDGANPPPVHALGRRGIVDNVVSFPVYGDRATPNPPRRIMAALARREIDVAVVWGPLAGYFARDADVEMAPVAPPSDAGLPSCSRSASVSGGRRRLSA